MTSAAAAGREPNRVVKWLAWLSHYDLHAIVGVIPIALIALVLPVNSSVQAWIVALPVLVMMFAISGRGFHEMIWPCDHCSARFPLNAPEQAQRRQATLRRYHKVRQTLIILGIALAVAIGGPRLLVSAVFNGDKAATDPWTILLPLSVYPVLAYYAWERHVHDRLQPWCPWCRRRDEDDDPIVVPEPTPPSARVDA